MKKIFVLIAMCLNFPIAYSQESRIEDVEKHIEMYADSVRQYSNYRVAEGFAYDLLNFINYIHIYGHDSEKTIKRFGDFINLSYTKIVSQIRYDILQTSPWSLSVDFPVIKSAVNLYRSFICEMRRLYGDEYIIQLQNASLDRSRRAINEYCDLERYQYSLLSTYNIYTYELIEQTYKDELVLYLLYGQASESLEYFKFILSSNLSEIAKAQMAQDCFDTVLNNQNPNLAGRILDMWNEYDDNSETHLYDYRERVRTKLGKLAYRQKNYLLAHFYSGRVDFVVEDKGKDIGSYFVDINEFLKQLEIRALVELNIGAEPELASRKALDYFEFADSLITCDVRCRNMVAPSPSMRSVIYKQLAELYLSIKDYETAEHIIQKANDNDKGYFNLNTSLIYAKLLMKQEKYNIAKDVLYKCIDEISLFKYNLDNHLRVYELLLEIEMKHGDKENLNQIAQKYFNIAKDYYFKELSLQSSSQRNRYWENEFNLQFMAPIAGHIATLDSKCVSAGYDASLFQKGLLLRFDAIEASNVKNSGDMALIEAYQHLLDCSEKEVPDSVKYIAAARYVNLYSMHPEFVTDIKHLSWKDVQSVLKPSEIAIEFIETYDSSNKMIYGAYLLGHDYEIPIYITLCESESLKALLRKSVSGGYYPDIYNPIAQSKVYNLIWSKIETHLEGIRKIYFSPHGLLTQLNIEVLAKAEDILPINQRYDMYRMSSTALLMEDYKEATYLSATLMGGVDYNYQLKSLSKIAHSTDTISISTSRSGGEMWSSLPHSSIEVESIEKLLRKKKVFTKSYTREFASEEAFKYMAYQSNSIIHIATHGFYYSSNDAQKWDYFISSNKDLNYISPMKRSGLVLAGGNHAWLGEEIPEGLEDGIVSALEIANMNLSNTELVVLSACQTGLGEISTEGVSGIQRAFKLAGVKTLVMSLWEVSDKATEILMTNFYSMLTNGKTKREAFDYAIKAVKKEYPSPEYWAAFIMLD